jgi:hypothetical protein
MAAIHHSSAHRRAANALRNQQLQPCILCGGHIDYQARTPHPDSFSAEHWPPISQAGDHHNLLPAHLGCQRTQGGQIRAGRHHEPPPKTSGVW